MANKKANSDSILVPIDFSPSSSAVLDQASELADALGLRLVVLHVVHDPGDAPGYYQKTKRKKVLRRLEDTAGDMLTDFMKRFAERRTDRTSVPDAEAMCVVGLPVSRILEIVDSISPRFIVMGSHGRTGMARLLLGSKAEQVVRLSPVPVMVVKPEETEVKSDKK